MKVECRDYIGDLIKIETMTVVTMKPFVYRVCLKINNRDYVDLKFVDLKEVEFVKEETNNENND